MKKKFSILLVLLMLFIVSNQVNACVTTCCIIIQLIGTKESYPDQDLSYHWLIEYGYEYNPDFKSEGFLVINDGFGKNNIWVSSNKAYYDEEGLFWVR